MFKNNSFSQKRHRLFFSICLFAFFAAYFCFGTGWYEPSRLVLQGQATQENPLLLVRWNSGEGFNTYEQRIFTLTQRRLEEKMTSRISFGATARRSSASLSKEIVCTALLIDGIPFDISRLAEYGRYADGELYFQGNQQASVTVSPTSHIGIKFRTNNHSGIASITVNGQRVERDLYIANVEAKFKQFDYWLLG
ncbi:MAG: hypothetical protein D3907_15800, partial [Candidatus Electrothrix sp. AUS3]|nr:hypothetical protein [Candidatus Electrothrix gigas]